MKANTQMILVGRVCRCIEDRSIVSNQDRLNQIRGWVNQYFRCSSTYIHGQEQLIQETCVYPKYYAAGWFVRYDGSVKQSVIVAHGNTMKEARSKMLELAKKIEWN